MEILKTVGPIVETRGREPKYPFKRLLEGHTLKINIQDEGDVGRIKSAFFQFRKYNKLKWKVRVQVVGDDLLIHRLKN